MQSIQWSNRAAPTHAALFTGSDGGFNLTGIAGEEYDAMLGYLRAEIDVERRLELSQDIQAYLLEHDGMVVWAFQDDLNASAPGLTGVTYRQSAPLFHLATLSE